MTQPHQPEIKVFPDPLAVAHAAAERVVRAANEAIALSGRYRIAVSGGSTPKLLYQLLAEEDYRSRIDWTNVEVYFVDERAVPPDHDESNYRMVKDALLSKVPIPGDNIYRIRGELEQANDAAKEYGLMLQEKLGAGSIEAGSGFDLILLGMGEDGHTASLFPGTAALGETKHRVVAQFVEHSTTGASWRITLTAPFINRSRQAMVLVTGAKKSKTLAAVLEGPNDPHRLPVQLVHPASGKLIWLIDAGAAGMHESD